MKLMTTGLAIAFLVPAYAQTDMTKSKGRFMANKEYKTTKAAVNARVVDNPTNYGEEQLILFEDFSKFTTGSVENPDFDTNINYENKDNAWINMSDEYTNMPGWGSHFAYPAGGQIYLNSGGESGTAQINTPMLDLSANDGIFFAEFKARTAKQGEICTFASLEAAETYDMSPSWTFLTSYKLPEINNTDQTFRFIWYGGDKTTMINLVTFGTDVVIDDFKVYQIKQYVGTPTALPHRKYNGTDFTARWTKVKDAESYLLNVYTKNGDEIGEYLKKDLAVTDTTCIVDGAESGKAYFYDVRAVKGGKQSIVSAPVEVFDLVPPTLGKVDVADSKYTASWEATPTAEKYNYTAYFDRKADKDGELVLTDENFDGILKPDGTPSGLTIENPDSYTYDETYLNELNQAGWRGKSYMPYTDYICLDAWQYIFNRSDAGLISPQFDLSKDNGNINIDLKLYGTDYYEYIDPEKPNLGTRFVGNVQCAVALFNYNEEKEDYEQVELVYVRDTKAEWKDFSVKLTKGSKRSTIGIYAVTYPENLYIDGLKITQNYKAGENFLDPFSFTRWTDKTSLEVTLPTKVDGSNVYHAIQAVKSRTTQDGGTEFKYSKWTDLTLAAEGVTAGIGEAPVLNLSSATVRVEGGRLVVNNPEGADVMVYGIGGNLMAKDSSKAATVYLPVPNGNGTYIVKVGNKSVKVSFQ